MAGPVVRTPGYKDFLQPALLRRFSTATGVLLAVAYVEAILLTSWSSYLWSWFPIGPAGVRTFFLFSCGLVIITLRFAHYHVGLRTTSPGWRIVTESMTSLSTFWTALWYCCSAVLFTVVYLQSTSEHSNMEWIHTLPGNRNRLNERPIFLSCYMIMLGLHQTFRHYADDADHLPLIQLGGTSQNGSREPSKQSSPNALLIRLPQVLLNAATSASLNWVITLVLYHLAIRSFAWRRALMFFRPFYNLQKSNLAPPHPAWSVYSPLVCLYCGVLVGLIWGMSNLAFTTYMAEEPLKNGKPLTFESKDPNGSLLNGLKNQKPSIKCFAMWELADIAENVEVRRQAIFQDIDRKDGPMWSQIYGVCIDAVKSIETRIDTFGRSTAAPPAAPVAKTTQERRRITAPMKEDSVYRPTQPNSNLLKNEIRRAVGSVTRTPGSPSKLKPLAGQALTAAKDGLRQAESSAQLRQIIMSVAHYKSLAGLFLHSTRKQIAGVVLGSPYAEPSLYKHAIFALCRLAVHSLTEDQFGNVHRDVPSIIRVLTSVVNKIEATTSALSQQSTASAGDKTSPEVDIVVKAAKEGLAEVVAKFEPYSRDLGLSLTDLRLAKEAAAAEVEEQQVEKTTEMRQVKA